MEQLRTFKRSEDCSSLLHACCWCSFQAFAKYVKQNNTLATETQLGIVQGNYYITLLVIVKGVSIHLNAGMDYWNGILERPYFMYIPCFGLLF